jgi:curved DNA-binding protein CbpA
MGLLRPALLCRYMQDYYETLQVHPKADTEAIRAAYERLRERYNPAKLEGAADELVELARRRRDDIERAYTVIGDAERRRDYDEALALRESAPTPLPPAVPGGLELDYRPLPPAQGQERPKQFNAQPEVRVRSTERGRAVAANSMPLWVLPTLIVSIATFAIVLVTLITTVLNAPAATPANPDAPNVLGQSTAVPPTPSPQEIVNRFEGQVVAARQVANQVPQNPMAWIELGNALYDSAVIVRERVDGGDETLRGLYIERLPRWLEAADAYREALELEPRNTAIRADLAASLCYFGSDTNDQSYVTEGLREAEQAVLQNPEHPRTLLSMGLCLVAADPPQTQRAMEQWQRLLILPNVDPNLAFQARALMTRYSQ